MSLAQERLHNARSVVAMAVVAVIALIGFLLSGPLQTARAASPASLPACPFWTNATPPARTDTPWIPPLQTAAPVNMVTGRLAVPAGITGTLANGQVTITLNRVAGAQAYRVWRNGQSVAWISDYGQPALTAVDTSPCQNAYYSVVALSDQSGSDASMGQLSAPYQLNAAGQVVPWAEPVGGTIQMMVTSYNDGGATASGYDSQLGVCAVDPRVIPWGTYFTVPGYGTCFAGDIGTWIQNDTVDVWLPGTQANDWGVQSRTVTIIANPYVSGDPTAPPSGGASATASPTATATPTSTPTAPVTTTAPPTTKPPTAPPTTVAPTTPPAGGNLVANPGFESGALSPWVCDAGTAAVVSTPVHAGSRALAITATNSDDAQCTQTVSVAPNTTYTLTDWVRGNYAYLGATVPGGTSASTWTPSAANWSQLTTTFTTGATTSTVTVYVHGWYGQAAVDVDDASLTG
ncbi:MAG TPA: carbohydrate binding domain-containing protein [Actinocrinis sp.]|nr:carbohydrate binding domain-containing protein [Actinocrinis sp.]